MSGLRPGETKSTSRTVEEMLDAIEATIEGDEIDFDDVTTPEKAKASALEVLAHVRDQLCDVAGKVVAQPEKWADRPTPEDDAIEAAFPTNSGRHDLYGEAMRLVGARHSKGALVALVTWLLLRIEQAGLRPSETQPTPSELLPTAEAWVTSWTERLGATAPEAVPSVLRAMTHSLQALLDARRMGQGSVAAADAAAWFEEHAEYNSFSDYAGQMRAFAIRLRTEQPPSTDGEPSTPVHVTIDGKRGA